jgi:outer membrane protein assembly factor BamB
MMPRPRHDRLLAAWTATLSLACAAGGCVGVPPPSALDERLDFPGVQVLKPHWRTPVVDPEQRMYRPMERSGALIDPSRGLVFVGTSEGRFLAVDSGMGRVVWSRREADGFHSTPLLIAEPAAIVVGDDGGDLIALSPDNGSETWRVNLGGTIRTQPVFADGVIYVRTTTQRVFAVEAVSGRELWSYERPLPEGYLSGGESGVLVTGERVVTGFVDGTLVSLSAVTGEKVWDLNLAGEGHDELLLDDICATPVQIGDLLVVTSYDNGVFGIDAAEGGQRWARSDLVHASGLAAMDEDVLVAVAGTGLGLLDTAAGATVWMRRYPAGTLRDPVVHGGLIIISDDANGLVVFESLTGVLLEVNWIGAGVGGPPAVVAGRVAALDNTGELFSFFLAGG